MKKRIAVRLIVPLTHSRAAAGTRFYRYIPDGVRADPGDFDVFRF